MKWKDLKDKQKYNSRTLIFFLDWWGLGESEVSQMPLMFLTCTSGSIVAGSMLKNEKNWKGLAFVEAGWAVGTEIIIRMK